VVVPDPDSLPSFAAKIGVKGSFEELCKNQVSMAQNVLQISMTENVLQISMTERECSLDKHGCERMLHAYPGLLEQREGSPSWGTSGFSEPPLCRDTLSASVTGNCIW
jgi:hypothetical protein